MNLHELWRSLEAGDGEQSPEAGVTVRRIDPKSRDGLFAGIRRPGGTRMLLLQTATPPRPADGPLIQSRGFITAVKRFSGDAGHLHLFIESAGPSFNEVFGYVAGDVAEHIFQRPASTQAVTAFLGRLDRWKRFFESGGGDGLSEISAQGLLAELMFLRDFAIPESESPEAAVSSWAVPEPLSKDFQYSHGAVEVKCSVTREHTKVHISGERQLDDTGFVSLYLFAVLLEKVATGGFSLPETVLSVRELLGDATARNVFEEKLLAYGCLDVHFPRYERRYILQRMRAFKVGKGFPRVPAVLPDGVGDLNYTVALAACAAFKVDPATLRTLIRESRSHDT
jgi:Putative  PD-(D/E)XK family member, (DUF4420)